MPYHFILAFLAILCIAGGCSAAVPISETLNETLPPVSATTVRPSPTPTRAVTPSLPPTAEPLEIHIPEGTPPTIDGTMDAGEWAAALVGDAGDGSEIHFMQADGVLYIGIRGSTPEMIVSNIFIAEGDSIRILHASAALGTAVYQQGEEGWEQQQEFDWRCRQTSQTEAALAERAAFLEDEGWVATNSRIGTPNELEFHIDLPETPFQLAMNILRSSNPDIKIPFPVDLDDDVITPTPGGYPAVMHFKPETWVVVDQQF